MKKTRNLLGLILATIVVSSLVLSACNDGGGSGSAPAPTPAPAPTDTTTTPAPDTTAEPAAPDANPVVEDSGLNAVTLKYTNIGSLQSDTARISQAMSNRLAEMGKPYSVDLTIVDWGAYDDVVNLDLNSGTKFDVVFTANWAASYYQNAPNGVFTDLGPYIAANPEIVNLLTADFMNASRVNGINYALPTNKEKARAFGWLLRKDIVDEMGMDISTINSVADLEPWFEKAYEEHNLWVFPSFIPSDYYYDRIEDPIVGIGAEPDASQVVAVDLEPRFIDAVKLYTDWFSRGWISPNRTRETIAQDEFKSGRYFGVTYQLKPGKDAEESASLGMDLVQVVLGDIQIANSETTGAMHAIPNASDNKDEAFDFIMQLYFDSDLINIMVWGEEGTDYTKVSDNVISVISDSGWDWAQGWTVGDQFKNYLTDNEDPNKWQEFINFNEAGRPLVSLGFVPDTTQLQNEIVGCKAIRENFNDLFYGYSDNVDGDFERLADQYAAAGMNDLLAEFQRQFDAWKATQ